jgi:hypothetical protein
MENGGGARSPKPSSLFGDIKPTLITSIEEICDFDRRLWEVTKGLPVRTGSVLRVGEDDLPYWGIGVSPENRESLKELADEFRLKDYRERDRDPHSGGAEDSHFKEKMFLAMRSYMAFVVREIIASLDDGKREFHICDLACGFGELSTSVAVSLRHQMTTAATLDRTTFHLVDYSETRLGVARSRLNHFQPYDITVNPMNDEEFLTGSPGEFDVIISLGHLHKKPFGEIYPRMGAALKSDGFVVSGDWHSSLCKHPLNTYTLLEMMGVEDRRLDMFRQLMGKLLDPFSSPGLTGSEIKAVEDHQRYWKNVQDRLLCDRRIATDTRMYFLGAFDTTRERKEKLESGGLCTDPEMIRSAFPRLANLQTYKQLFSNSDRAAVIAGMKRHR